MCNLFENTVSFAELVEAFGQYRAPILRPGPQAAPNWPPLNAVRPTDFTPVVRAFEDGAEVSRMRWGFAPERPKAGPVTNFRAEGRRFGNGEDRGRCLVPASAFFEFTGRAYPKTRWRFTEASQPWLCLAGLWRRREAAEGPDTRFTLLTTAPGPDMASYHDRQVVVLARERWSDWLTGVGDETQMLQPGPAGHLAVTCDTPAKAPLPLFGDAP
jgi:putative SOS response-associated peptidase YedK